MASWVPPILSSLLAGVVAIVSTVAIEKLGGAVGGVIASSPTSSVLASIGIAIQSPERLDEAMHSIPTVMLINTLFLHVWRVLPPYLPNGWKFNKKLTAMICITLGTWFSVALTFVAIVRYGFNNNILAIQIIGGLAMATQLALGLTAVLKQKRAVAKAKNSVGIGTLLSRGVLASTAVILAILLSKINGTVAALATAFPAVFTTTMISLWISQGEHVTSGAVGPMILGAFSGPVFAIAMSQLAPLWGPFIGAFISYIIAIVTCSIPVGFILNKLEARYKPLEEDNKVVDESTADESEHDTQPAQIDLDKDSQSPQIELTENEEKTDDSNDNVADLQSKSVPNPAHN